MAPHEPLVVEDVPRALLGMAPEICTLCAAKWREMEEMSREYAERLAGAWRKAVERRILEGGDSGERNPEASWL